MRIIKMLLQTKNNRLDPSKSGYIRSAVSSAFAQSKLRVLFPQYQIENDVQSYG